jgi:hypothetical protein
MARRSPQHTPGQPVRVPERRSRRTRSGLAALCQALGIAGPLWAAGCERRAPGPDECVAFAEAWVRRHRAPTRLEADTAFDELVRTCLTDPYDRELVACVVGGDDQEGCRRDYMRRAEERRESRER